MSEFFNLFIFGLPAQGQNRLGTSFGLAERLFLAVLQTAPVLDSEFKGQTTEILAHLP